jgi:hypothetical protein
MFHAYLLDSKGNGADGDFSANLAIPAVSSGL